jgi:hypothetical protein
MGTLYYGDNLDFLRRRLNFWSAIFPKPQHWQMQEPVGKYL